MASRLVFQKLSAMSRPASRLGAHVSAARAAAAPAARYFNVFPCFHADAKTSLTTTGFPSTIMNNMKPALDFGRGVARTFSSSASKSNSHKFTMEAKIATRQAQDAARKPEKSMIHFIIKDVDTAVAMMAFGCFNILYMLSVEDNDSSCCCKKCQCHSNPKLQQD